MLYRSFVKVAKGVETEHVREDQPPPPGEGLPFFERAAIKAGRGVGVDGGFIEDVKEGVRLVVERTTKDISYQALRLMKLIRSILFTILPT